MFSLHVINHRWIPTCIRFQTSPCTEDAVEQCGTHQLPQSVHSFLGLHAKPAGRRDFVSSICSPPDVWTSSGSISASRKLDPCMKMRLSNDHLVLQMHCRFCRQQHEARNKVMHKFVMFPCLNFCHQKSLVSFCLFFLFFNIVVVHPTCCSAWIRISYYT